MSEIRTHHPVAWRLMSGRFAQSEYLALHLAVGFAVSLAVIAIFASITEGLVESSPLTRFDVIVAARLRESVTPAALGIFEFLSSLGGRGAMTMLLFGGALVFALRRRGLEAIGWWPPLLGRG